MESALERRSNKKGRCRAGGPGSEVVDITVGERITLRHVSRE
jgi:hypothetical protein